MLPEAIETGNGFRKITDSFRDESFHQWQEASGSGYSF